MSSNQKRWQGSEQMGITSREFFGQKHRVVWYCHSCENSMQWQRAVRSRLYSEWAREGHCINPFTLVHLSNLILLSLHTSSYSWWPNCWYMHVHCPWMGFIASENKAIHTHTHPSLLHSKLGCLLFSTSSLNSDSDSDSFGVGKMSERSFREKCIN